MDYYNIDSEIIDPLDYLRPPVKRIRNSSKERTFGINFNDPHDVRWLNKITNRESKQVNKTHVESSTSLILKKTSGTEILQKYPIVSQTDVANHKIKAKDKPLIKVTVIPKRDAQTNSIRKRKHVKRVHSAVSNHENTIKTKNVYLVVGGRRREKFYEIKTTGSAQFSKDHSECCFKDIKKPLEQLSNYKDFIDSLNMDKKRKKNKKKKQKGDSRINDTIQDDGDIHHECMCSDAARDTVRPNVRSPRSRVTIFGRVGVTEDDRYVLNYSATVNNEPVPVKCSPARCHFLPLYLGNNEIKQKIPTNNKKFGCVNECINEIYGSCYVCNDYRRDSNIQADFPDDNTYYKLMDKNTSCNKESQGTQANFNVNLTNVDTTQFQNKVRRYGSCECEHEANLPDNKNNLKDSQSPLVIISVYPKKDVSDIGGTIICPSGNACQSSMPKTYVNTPYSQKIGDSTNTRKNVDSKNRKANVSHRISRSRSPSPATKNISRTQFEPRVPRTNIRKESPDRRLTNGNQKIQKNSANQKSNARKTKDKTLNCQETNKEHNFNIKLQETKGTNTEHLLAKKALVDNYTKNIASQMNRNGKTLLKNNVSNVKININGENEDYDVLFYEDDCTTDLKVRKTTKKEVGSQRRCGGPTIDPMQNVLQTTRREPKQWPLLQDLYNDPSNDDLPITSRISRLKLRDSLEIGYRRDDKTPKNIKDTQTSENSKVNTLNSNDMKFLAPIKHYAGDKCSVPDPSVRDKEIRELLGIEKGKATTSNVQDTKAWHRNNEQVPLQCFYHQERKRRGLFDDEINNANFPCDCCKINAKINKHSKTPRTCEVMTKSTSTQYQPQAIERASLFQQMTLTRNIQVLLQVEQFTKQKPIILSRKQYNKVKRTIQDTITRAQERRRSKCICKASIISVGEIRKKAKAKLRCLNNKETQIESQDLNTDAYQEKEKPSTRCIGFTTSKQLLAPISQMLTVDSQNEQHDGSECSEQKSIGSCIKNVSARKTVSSMEICYASVAYLKHVTFSSTNIRSVTPPNIAPRTSIQTIFKGRRKSLTPNLGTSAFSLFSEMGDSKSVKVLMPPRESQPKKPFLRRLMSCLVMRSTRASEVKVALPTPQEQSVDSTIDSYHISTSLGAIELSSSIYDTSASFYSNHSILPMSNKMKRGFLSSVRGYLTNRKS